MTLTWNNPEGDRIEPMLREMKEAGYDGVSGFAHFGTVSAFIDNPLEWKKLLDRNGLKMASLDVTERPTLDYYKKVCEFLQANECSRMVYIDPKGGQKEFERLGTWLNRIGELTQTYGVQTLYHNHTRGIGEQYQEVERVYASVDPAKVFKMLDLGHATKDFVDIPEPRVRAMKFLTKHWSDIAFMEFKDWNEETDLNTPIGEGYCDYEAVFALMRGKGYQGWVLIEQNGIDGLSRGRSPLECAKLSLEFLRRGLGI